MLSTNRISIVVVVVWALFGSAVHVRAADHLTFNQPFAPQAGVVAAPEQPLRDELCLNGTWRFEPIATPASFKPNRGDAPALPPPSPNGWDSTSIRIPSPWNVNAFPNGPTNELGLGGDYRAFPSYPKAWEKVDMGWLRRSFRLPAGWNNRRIFLRFNAVAGAVQVLVNGKPVGEHFENFLPFEFDITDALHVDSDNELLVGVRRPDLFNDIGQVGRRPYVAGSMWGEGIVGIWQDVFLLAVPNVRVSDLLIQPQVDTDHLVANVTLRNDTAHEQTVDVGGDVQPWVNLAGTDVLEAPLPKWRLDPSVLQLPPQQVVVPANGSATVTLQQTVDGKLNPWSPDSPNLYGLTLSVNNGSTAIDRKYTRFGWRQLKLSNQYLELNGKPLPLKGDAWHFVGVPEMTRRYAWAWYKALKGANCNAVRLHAEPYPSFFLDVADEQGVMVLDETGIWGSDGSPKLDSPQYWDAADAHVHGLVMRDRNHPSVLGYSVTNEVLVIMRNYHASAAAMQMAFDRYTKWVDEIHQIDPNHPWISGDGEEDVGGRLPVLIGHYGGFEAPKRWSAKGKPWGVGECGMAYYGTPKQVSQYNGALAYESMQGRLDGVAREAYKLITQTHQPLHAAYSSVFNVVWYGLHPLPLGMSDTTHPPTIDEGIWFGPMVEGVPGMQPERLGPYVTTLNPGYDPKLPLFQPWPLYDAIKAANAPGGPVPSEYDHLTQTTSAAATPPATAPTAVQLLDAGANDPVRLELSLMGVDFAEQGSATPASIIIISGEAPPSAAVKSQVDATLSSGGTIFVWHPVRSHLSALNAVLPMALQLNDRNSTSLVPLANDQLTQGLTAADFYFTELKPDVILDGGLAGPLADAGRAILQAPRADWRRWNNRPELIKTGSIARSEAEAQPSGIAMVVTPVGTGRVIVANLAGMSAIPERVVIARRLLTNLGIGLLPPRDLIGGGIFSNAGVLRRALVLGRFALDESAHNAAGPGPGISLPSGASSQDPRPGMKVGAAEWKEKDANATQVFELGHPDLSGPGENAAAYVSFWINSPRSLDDVLSEPDVPRVDLLIGGSDRAASAWLNGNVLTDDAKTADANGCKSAYSAVVLKRGWNHVLLRLTHRNGQWQFSATLQCSDRAFLSKLEAALQPPMR